MSVIRIPRFPVMIFALGVLVMPQTARRPAMSYEVESPPVAGAPAQPQLRVRTIQGEVRDREGMAIPHVGLGLFTDTPDHRFLRIVVTGDNGSFDFGHVAPGSYRLVAKYPGLCTANIPLSVDRNAPGRHILLRMEYPGLDVCSRARLK